ncbi:hypothetical protein [Polaribacter sp. L3A8]|uniref:hypothetical protein n=1 Tax=Polaribacter sp. L3A8 TaxID=2686361 RepID=UPI00131B446E|nr:hypothetical protein [Polaribacter sp. L3A8]
MPNAKLFKVQGSKIVPANRFNLKASKPSISFNAIKPNVFSVIKHPVVHSINFVPVKSEAHLPLVSNRSKITKTTVFTDKNNSKLKLQFPKIVITPLNNTLFYYETTLDSKGNEDGYLGKVTLKYSVVKIKKAGFNYVDLDLKEVILNLKVKQEVIKINGLIDVKAKSIIFKLKDEAVKIAFFSLITEFDDFKSSVDLFFAFKGYSNPQVNSKLAVQFNRIKDFSLLRKKVKLTQSPLLFRNKKVESNLTIRNFKKLQIKNKVKPTKDSGLVKSTFLLRINEKLNYQLPENTADSIYKNVNGGLNNNPFNLNVEYSEFQQIYLPGIENNYLSIYKSALQPNTFLLVPKQYHLTRDIDTMQPCITTIFHAFEDGTGLTEDISKISFLFAIGPKLSDFDLAKLKIDLYNNNCIEKDNLNYFDEIQFLFPNDIGAKYEVTGNSFLQKAAITVDGKYFIFNSDTESLNEASLLINALNNSVSQYANINFSHKEIKDSSILELNVEKSTGEAIKAEIIEESKKIKLENISLSPCRVNAVLSIDQANKTFINKSFFNNFQLIESEGIVLLNQNTFLSNNSTEIKELFFNHESIEDLSSEFSQIVSSSTDYNRYVTVRINSQKDSVKKVFIDITIDDTGSSFKIMKHRQDFRTPILFNFILKNTENRQTTISCKTDYFDVNDNLMNTITNTIDYTNTANINIQEG